MRRRRKKAKNSQKFQSLVLNLLFLLISMASMANRAIKIGPPAVLWPHLLALPLTRIITLSNSLSLSLFIAHAHALTYTRTHNFSFSLFNHLSVFLPSRTNLDFIVFLFNLISFFILLTVLDTGIGLVTSQRGEGSVAERSKVLQSIWEISKITGS